MGISPDSYDPSVKKTVDFVFLAIEFFILMIVAGGYFTISMGTSRFIFTSPLPNTPGFVNPASVHFYNVMPVPMQAKTYIYGWDYYIITSDYWSVPLIMIPLVFSMIGFKTPYVYGITISFFVIFSGFVDLLKAGYFLFAWVNCNNFWFCRSVDSAAPLSGPSRQFYVILIAAGVRLILNCLFLLSELGLIRLGQYVRNAENAKGIPTY
jgi:hypothetical protein